MVTAMRVDRRARKLARRFEAIALHDSGLPQNVRRAIGLVTGPVPPIGYLGFAGRGNAGDDAILLAHKRSLHGVPLAMLPLEWDRQALSLLGRVKNRPLNAGVLVGGGTLIGRYPWRRRLERALQVGTGPLAYTGVGVEDPSFVGARRHTDEDELLRWADVLNSAAHLTVRGPRSAELLHNIGIEAPVVSDPALLLGPEEPDDSVVRPKLLGINLADPEDQYAATGSRVFDESVSALRTLQASGWTVRLLPFDRKDLVVARRARRTLGDRTEIMSRFLDVDALRRSIAECDVLVGQRLHSVVLAAAVGVPAVAIDYRPKCRDFQLSIDRQDWTVSTIDITAGGVLDMVIALHEQRAHHADRIHQEVARAKRALRAGELELRRLFGAAPS
jgi:hypothetical protein